MAFKLSFGALSPRGKCNVYLYTQWRRGGAKSETTGLIKIQNGCPDRADFLHVYRLKVGFSFSQLHVNAKCCELVIHPVFGSADLEANPFEPPTGQRARRRRRSEIRHQKTNTASLFPCLASNFPVLAAAASNTCACCIIPQLFIAAPPQPDVQRCSTDRLICQLIKKANYHPEAYLTSERFTY